MWEEIFLFKRQRLIEKKEIKTIIRFNEKFAYFVNN